MTRPGTVRRLAAGRFAVVAVICAGFALAAPKISAQTGPVERTFRAPKSVIEKALKQLQPAMSGHLPTIEGFVLTGDHPLTRYQRAFFQCTVQVNETPAGSVVRVSANVTAWDNDTAAPHSGYQLLKSNGRLESDLLDQLSAQLSGGANHAESSAEDKTNSVEPAKVASSSASVSASNSASDLPIVSAPMPNASGTGSAFPSSSSRLTGTGLGRRSATGPPSSGPPRAPQS